MSSVKSKIKIIVILVVILLCIPLALMLSNKGAPVSWGWWGPVNADDGIAIDGYDAVAYFDSNEAVQGSAQHSVEWNGANWYFVSAEHKVRFEQQPERYAPQYGGYCATAVGAGISFDSDPQAWHIADDKLYLFYDDGAKQDWLSKLDAGVVATADDNWASRAE